MKNAIALLVASAALGCGGSGGGPGGGARLDGSTGTTTDAGTVSCGASAVGGGVMGWLDDGAGLCADVVVLSSATGNQSVSLNIIGATPVALSMNISITGPGQQLSGSFPCGSTDTLNVRLAYAGNGISYTLQSCQITVNQPDANRNVSGTFSATLMTASGATKQITGGSFKGPISMLGG